MKLTALAAILVLVLMVFWAAQHDSFGFSVGRPLPRGKVAPQLVSGAWNFGVLLGPDGSLWCWGGTAVPKTHLVEEPTEVPQRIGSAADWCRVAAAHSHALALKTNGSLWGWGYNGCGAAAQAHSREQITEPTRIDMDSDWTQIAVGEGHCLALKSDGSLWAWGQNDRGQVGNGTTTHQFTVSQIGHDHDWRAITAGDFSSFALKNDGTLWGWGHLSGTHDDLSPRPIDLCSNVVAISANDYFLLALRSDRTLWIAGPNAPATASAYVTAATATLVQIGKDKDWKDVYAGKRFFMAQKANGSWWVCGECQTARDNRRMTSPKRLPLKFEAWSLVPGLGNAWLLTCDGALWNLSIRPESGSFAAAFMKAKVLVNQLLGVLPGHPQPFNLRLTFPH